jgi:hypothetical protein
MGKGTNTFWTSAAARRDSHNSRGTSALVPTTTAKPTPTTGPADSHRLSCHPTGEGSESAAGSYDPGVDFGAGHLAPHVSE